ncbi:PREDICTED: uncharacterized family 31 glucosidase KIAA1161-like [Rhagoletis zephyria]|uniref:uncharacterized family 31 glucosidase KIAA1161-like n=1 Tax=Rhagoletis zephyria TaxID=28612 RepID=UPI0008117353|nr:PREDICTED: uncharacterized family 31 glucosidase KIAA1161-like [Rhagoletis zephyria]
MKALLVAWALVAHLLLNTITCPSSLADDSLSGVYDFRVLDSKTLLFSNPFRANAHLKITFRGANFSHLEHHRPGTWNSWELVSGGLNSSQASPASNTVRINNQTNYAGRTTYYTFLWDHHLHNLHANLSFPDQEICFEIQEGGNDNATSWFSTSLEKGGQPWPFNRGPVFAKGPQPLVTGSGKGDHPFGPVVEKIFISSGGFALNLAQQSFPTIITREGGGGGGGGNGSGSGPLQLCSTVRQFKSDRENPTHFEAAGFELVATEDIVKLHRSLLNHYHLLSVPYPHGAIPGELMFNRTVVNLNVKNLKQAEVIEKVIALSKSGGFKNLQVVLEGWEAHLGDFTFDPARFPNPKSMVADIHKLGFLVKLTVHGGLASTSSASFRQHPQFFLSQEKDHKKAFTFVTSQNDTVAVFDWVGNYAVRNWFVDHLRVLMRKSEIAVDSFRFVGLDTQFGGGVEDKLVLPLEKHIFKHNWYGSKHYGNVFTQRLVYMADLLHEHGGSLLEIDAAYQTQFFPLFIRMRDIPAEWLSLSGIIPQALTLGLAGYSFPLPPVFAKGPPPTEEELYIRWLQLVTFFPSMQLSPGITTLSPKAANLTTTFLALHLEHSQTMVALARASTKAGEPLMRPLWYLAPADPKSYLVGDQFALGNDLIVAPVLVQGARERSVYLPIGTWNDQHGKTYTCTAPTVVKVLAPLEELPYFKRKM